MDNHPWIEKMITDANQVGSNIEAQVVKEYPGGKLVIWSEARRILVLEARAVGLSLMITLAVWNGQQWKESPTVREQAVRFMELAGKILEPKEAV